MTKGPWRVFWIASPAGTSARIYSEGTTPHTDIAHIPKEWNGDGSNARLIAAALELAEAARNLLHRELIRWPPGVSEYPDGASAYNRKDVDRLKAALEASESPS